MRFMCQDFPTDFLKDFLKDFPGDFLDHLAFLLSSTSCGIGWECEVDGSGFSGRS